MINVDYVCRCGKLFHSLFQVKRHTKYECTMKHIPVVSTGKGIRIRPVHPKEEK